MNSTSRSACPINLTLEIVGDRWSLLIIRDIIFGNRRHFRELLTHSLEGIASNILADRLKRLVGQGILTRQQEPNHRQKALYSLTPQGIELVPVLAQLSGWGLRHLPVSEAMAARAQVLQAGGPRLWARFMKELAELHLGGVQGRRGKVRGRSVTQRMQSAYEAATMGSPQLRKRNPAPAKL
jgi:DNA-binding HxlR family transcriptional regulator